MPTGLLKTKRGGGSGGWWHPARLSGSPGPLDLSISPAPERCEPGSPTTSEAGCPPAPIAQHLQRNQLSRTRFYTPHRYRPLGAKWRRNTVQDSPPKARQAEGNVLIQSNDPCTHCSPTRALFLTSSALSITGQTSIHLRHPQTARSQFSQLTLSQSLC